MIQRAFAALERRHVLAGAAVVRSEHHDGVLLEAELLEGGEDAADVHVHRLDRRGERRIGDPFAGLIFLQQFRLRVERRMHVMVGQVEEERLGFDRLDPLHGGVGEDVR